MKPTIFVTESSWVEGNAIKQIEQTSMLPGVQDVAAMPDLCVSKGCAVGSVALTKQIVYPHLIGNDVGCGYTYFQTTIPSEKLKLDKMASRLVGLDNDWDGDRAGYGFGTIGGGNHFVELQKIAEIIDKRELEQSGIDPDFLVLLVHSGSRALGEDIWQTFATACGSKGFEQGTTQFDSYLLNHNEAVDWATRNRAMVATRFLECLDSFGKLILDLPHNFVETKKDGLLHRKGASPSDRGFSPLPGSRGTYTYLLKPLAPEKGLGSLAHGAGRRYSRSSMHGRVNLSPKDMKKTSFGGIVVCGDNILLAEEHDSAYKSVEKVLSDLKFHGLADSIATLQPVLTYKSAEDSKHDDKRPKREKEYEWRRDRHRNSRDRRS